MIRIAIVEDNADDARTISEYCSKFAQENNKQIAVTVYSNGLDFVTQGNHDFDIIMLDVKMPYMNGLQTAKKIRDTNQNVVIVFITSMQQYAVHGYSVDATDFLVKPVKYSTFLLKFPRILSVAERNQDKTVMIKTSRSIRYLNISDILYIESDKHKIIFHTTTENYETWGSMKETWEQYRNYGFAMCSYSFLVNLRHVEEVTDTSVIMRGMKLPISRTKRKGLIDALMTYHSVPGSEMN